MAKRILFVDDEAEMVEVAGAYLQRAGFEVRTALDGREALTCLQGWLPDVIVADVVMPEMDGYELYKALKEDERTRDIPVIILTARKAMEDAFRALGAEEFLSKPFELHDLRDRIAYMINVAEQDRRFRIIVGGSDQDVIAEMIPILERMACDVSAPVDSQGLITAALKDRPDMVLIDILTQDIEAREVIKALRSITDLHNLLIVTYSQFDPEQMRDYETVENLKQSKIACDEAGATKYIGRFSPLSLGESIRPFLTRSV